MTGGLQSVSDKYKKKLMKKMNVVGVGVGQKIVGGKKQPITCITVLVEKKVDASELKNKDFIPASIDGYDTDVIEVGEIKAQQSPTGRFRPILGGISIGHFNITAGTLGCFVKRVGDNKDFILSNNHVLANSNDASIGDKILQPGTYDGGTISRDTVANLTDFVPIEFEGGSSPCPFAKWFAVIINWLLRMIGSKTRLNSVSIKALSNLVDAAIAEPFVPYKREILNIGLPKPFISPSYVGMKIKKMGRTTGLTHGEVLTVGTMVRVNYGDGKMATFDDQIVAGNMSAGGDSGSAVLNEDDDSLVGLLFAGSDTSTIINKMQHVFDELGLTV